eukprot:SAG31_NODE_4117_length_3566_cov_5.807038_3_plen_362_part_00
MAQRGEELRYYYERLLSQPELLTSTTVHQILGIDNEKVAMATQATKLMSHLSTVEANTEALRTAFAGLDKLPKLPSLTHETGWEAVARLSSTPQTPKQTRLTTALLRSGASPGGYWLSKTSPEKETSVKQSLSNALAFSIFATPPRQNAKSKSVDVAADDDMMAAVRDTLWATHSGRSPLKLAATEHIAATTCLDGDSKVIQRLARDLQGARKRADEYEHKAGQFEDAAHEVVLLQLELAQTLERVVDLQRQAGKTVDAEILERLRELSDGSPTQRCKDSKGQQVDMSVTGIARTAQLGAELATETTARKNAEDNCADLRKQIEQLEAELRRRPPLADHKIQRSPRRQPVTHAALRKSSGT